MVGALMLGWVGAAAAMAPVVPACAEPQALVREREPLVGTVQWTARLWLRGYQELISPADGRACRGSWCPLIGAGVGLNAEAQKGAQIWKREGVRGGVGDPHPPTAAPHFRDSHSSGAASLV